MPAPPEDQPHTDRIPPPPAPTTEADVLSGLEKERRRTQRKIDGIPIGRGLGQGAAQGTGTTPCDISFDVPPSASFICVSVRFTEGDEGISGMSAGIDEDTYWLIQYVDGGSVQYTWPVVGGATHTTGCRTTDGSATATATAFFF